MKKIEEKLTDFDICGWAFINISTLVTETKYVTVTNIFTSTVSFYKRIILKWGTRWCSWLRHCATCRKFAGSIPNGVIGIFH